MRLRNHVRIFFLLTAALCSAQQQYYAPAESAGVVSQVPRAYAELLLAAYL